MKRIGCALCALLFLLPMLFASCTGKTPDVLESEREAAVNLDSVTWTLEVEGADASSYTRAEAEKHALSKTVVSMWISYTGGDIGDDQHVTSFLVQGIRLSEFLSDVGRPDAEKITCYGTDVNGRDISFTVSGELLSSEKVLLGWIRNKTELLPDTKTNVGVFGSSSLADFTSCSSVSKIVIE